MYAALIYLYHKKLLNVILKNVQYIAFPRKDIKGCRENSFFEALGQHSLCMDRVDYLKLLQRS